MIRDFEIVKNVWRDDRLQGEQQFGTSLVGGFTFRDVPFVGGAEFKRGIPSWEKSLYSVHTHSMCVDWRFYRQNLSMVTRNFKADGSEILCCAHTSTINDMREFGRSLGCEIPTLLKEFTS